MAVEILLSTYNGEKFLREQLDSLLAQTYQDWRLVVRDDGSSDATLTILSEYAQLFPARFDLRSDGQRLGAKASFARLLEYSSADYIAFCDQDDVWLPEKLDVLLNAAMAAENGRPDIPVLVHSDLEVVGAELEPLTGSFWAFQGIDPSRDRLGHLVVQNVVTGCATLFNKALRSLVLPIPPQAVMHDHWMALVASACGRIVAVEKPLVRYRQHGANTVGAKRMPGLFSLPGKTFTRAGWPLDYRSACAQAAALVSSLETRCTAADRLEHAKIFADLYAYGWMKRRCLMLYHGILPSNLRRQISVLLRV